MAVNLKLLAQQMDTQIDDWRTVVDRKTGEIISVEERFLDMIEEEEDTSSLLDWEKEKLALAEKVIEERKNMVLLPSQYELRGYHTMEMFADTYEDEHIRDCLLTAIQGRGAFRRFKDTLHRFGIADKWYAYKEETLLKFARRWCKENDIAYED